jgi:hypothetical protein
MAGNPNAEAPASAAPAFSTSRRRNDCKAESLFSLLLFICRLLAGPAAMAGFSLESRRGFAATGVQRDRHRIDVLFCRRWPKGKAASGRLPYRLYMLGNHDTGDHASSCCMIDDM